MSEATQHPHMKAREVFITRHGIPQPAPAPRFSRTPSNVREPVTANLGDIVKAWGGT
jgi:alpha-methylacyl-CoA racemase